MILNNNSLVQIVTGASLSRDNNRAMVVVEGRTIHLRRAPKTSMGVPVFKDKDGNEYFVFEADRAFGGMLMGLNAAAQKVSCEPHFRD